MAVGPKANTLVLALGIALALASAYHALVMSTRSARPQLTLSFAPTDPIALSRVGSATQAAAITKKQAVPAGIANSARIALQGLALNPEALRLLAAVDGPANVSAIDMDLVNLSGKISRRDIGTQGLIIAEAAAREDFATALKAYDRTLRTKEQSWEPLFPLLAQLFEIPDGRQHFDTIFEANPFWLVPFLKTALARTDDPRPYAEELIAKDQLKSLDRENEVQIVLINALVANFAFDELQSALTYADFADSSLLRTAAITPQTVSENAPTTAHWFFVKNPSASAVPINSEMLSVSVQPGRSAIVAQKLLVLPPGTYRLSTKISNSQIANSAQLDWKVQCLISGTKARNLLDRDVVTQDAIIMVTFEVSEKCDAVMLLLEPSSNSRTSGASEALVESLKLSRI